VKFITDSQLTKLITNACASCDAYRTNQETDQKPVVKIFGPDSFRVWLLTELDPHRDDLAYGLVDEGDGFPELGYVRLSELRTVRGKLGMPVDRDRHFVADKTINAYAETARVRGFIKT